MAALTEPPAPPLPDLPSIPPPKNPTPLPAVGVSRESDYQTGAWDTDAAENIAYDKARHKAYVASADTGIVKVVDVTDPTSMTEIGTLNVGANLMAYCTSSSFGDALRAVPPIFASKSNGTGYPSF